jgi:predicted ATPase
VRPRGGVIQETVERFLADKTILLLLDGCDEASEVDLAGIVSHLLASTPGLSVLATSAVSLGVTGEHVQVLGGLPYPDPADGPPAEELRTYDAVRLFLDRAHAVRPGFSLDADNAPAVAELCAHLEGIPGELERAATRLRALSPAQLVHRLAPKS